MAWVRTNSSIVSSTGLRAAECSVARIPLVGYFVVLASFDQTVPLDFSELSEWDLLSTFSRLMRETLANHKMHIDTDDRPLRWHVDRLVRSCDRHVCLRNQH